MHNVVGDLEKTSVDRPRVVPGIKALILDDSAFDRRRIRRLTHDTRLGIVLDEISSIDALEAVLDQDRFDVILLDFKLPTGDGIEALKKIRDHSVNGNCPTIMVTGDDNSDVAVKSLKMGCADYIAKDQLTAETLRNSIVSAIENVAQAKGMAALVEADVEKITTMIMAKYTNAMQPKLARVIRDMRTLRSTVGRSGANIPDDLERIERQCIQMWAVLLDPKTVTGKPEMRH